MNVTQWKWLLDWPGNAHVSFQYSFNTAIHLGNKVAIHTLPKSKGWVSKNFCLPSKSLGHY